MKCKVFRLRTSTSWFVDKINIASKCDPPEDDSYTSHDYNDNLTYDYHHHRPSIIRSSFAELYIAIWINQSICSL
ncbi:hypothetical protein Syun_031106 [Stephania yunnanensis]|uniref:Uncharacterized protein n=1 Tax=Stephania yunnanensis TaxID=152371 RepID=A0AAP0HE75_9MAGN